jgi:hypothetical protein
MEGMVTIPPRKTLPVRLLLALSVVHVRNFKYHPIFLLDSLGHQLHLPQKMKTPLCDTLDWYLGVWDDDETDDGTPG